MNDRREPSRNEIRQYRRRHEQIRRAKRIRSIKRMLLCFLVMTVLVVCMAGAKKVFLEKSSTTAGTGEEKPEELSVVRSTKSEKTETQIPYFEELKAMESQDERISTVIDNIQDYPEEVLKILANNIETLDFVLDYPQKKNQPCEETIGENPVKGEIPLLLQWDRRWGYGSYGSSIVAVSGCGPTCIAMVASGLTGRNDITPYTVAQYSENNGFLTAQLDTSWDLMTYGCEAFGITGTMLGLDEGAMVNTLNAGMPIICSVGKGDFTSKGHFIVLTGYTDGGFQVHDPNSKVRSSQSWTYEKLKGQILNMWYYTLN